ncbi:formate dehydrogenase accessory sulfurtransferase FdhD [Rapidithrix thailandica]|uniref:Sulfur carrier protein FdhD n=1 Tax=Rapidithrix thailandica TaxID=413964 RepID=A0AAW9S8A7_9BACT
MPQPIVQPVDIQKYQATQKQCTTDLLAVEEPLEIRLGYGPVHQRKVMQLSLTMRTPGHDFELAIGLLLAEGIIDSYQQVFQIKYCTSEDSHEISPNIVRVELQAGHCFDTNRLKRNLLANSSCGICGKASIEAIQMTACPALPKETIQINPAVLLSLPERLQEAQQVFGYTGGLHATALFEKEANILFAREDIGRHNSVDKVIGAALYKNLLPLHSQVMLVSGRAGFELIQKAVKAGVSVFCAIGAPSSLAVDTAKAFGLTLVGFLRNQQFNVYSGEWRIANKK